MFFNLIYNNTSTIILRYTFTKRIMMVDKACDYSICMKADECKRNQAYRDGDTNVKTFKGNERKGCGQFIQK